MRLLILSINALLKFRAYTTLNVVGLAVSLACVLTIARYIHQENTVNRCFPDYERICLRTHLSGEENCEQRRMLTGRLPLGAGRRPGGGGVYGLYSGERPDAGLRQAAGAEPGVLHRQHLLQAVSLQGTDGQQPHPPAGRRGHYPRLLGRGVAGQAGGGRRLHQRTGTEVHHHRRGGRHCHQDLLAAPAATPCAWCPATT